MDGEKGDKMQRDQTGRPPVARVPSPPPLTPASGDAGSPAPDLRVPACPVPPRTRMSAPPTGPYSLSLSLSGTAEDAPLSCNTESGDEDPIERRLERQRAPERCKLFGLEHEHAPEPAGGWEPEVDSTASSGRDPCWGGQGYSWESRRRRMRVLGTDEEEVAGGRRAVR